MSAERDRIDVYAALGAACAAHPEQRVMQVVVNALGSDPFYVEDGRAATELFRYAQRRVVHTADTSPPPGGSTKPDSGH